MEEQVRKEYIEQYLRGELKGDEKSAFEEKLSDEETFREEVETAKSLILGLRGAAVLKEIEAIHQDEQAKERPSIRLNWVYGIAASVALILFAWWLLPANESDDTLFASNFQPYPNIVSLRNNQVGEFNKGMKYYSAGNYEEVVNYLEKASVPQERLKDQKFYLGISNLALKKPKEAIKYFELLNEAGSRYDQQVHWYLGLAYLLNEEKVKAISTLALIQNDEFEYASARKLLEQLNER